MHFLLLSCNLPICHLHGLLITCILIPFSRVTFDKALCADNGSSVLKSSMELRYWQPRMARKWNWRHTCIYEYMYTTVFYRYCVIHLGIIARKHGLVLAIWVVEVNSILCIDSLGSYSLYTPTWECNHFKVYLWPKMFLTCKMDTLHLSSLLHQNSRKKVN